MCIKKVFIFRSLNGTAEDLYKQCKILRFRDLVSLQNFLFMYKLEQNKKIAKTFAGLTHTSENYNCNIRSVNQNY